MIMLANLQKKQQMIIIYIVTNLNKSNNKQGNIKVLMITLFHSRLPFLNFFGQIMNFCNSDWAILIRIYIYIYQSCIIFFIN
jgi:hypothetical protein